MDRFNKNITIEEAKAIAQFSFDAIIRQSNYKFCKKLLLRTTFNDMLEPVTIFVISIQGRNLSREIIVPGPLKKAIVEFNKL